jgi:uncharacterized phage-associated protein
MTFNARKAAQVIAFFIAKSGAPSINVLKAIKLVYLGDRESIKKFGFPILDEARVSMPRGPVNSTTYSHVNGEYDLDDCGWSDFLEDREHHQIAVRKNFTDDDLDELSEADVESLTAVWDQFGGMNQWQLVQFTHDRKNVPEWEDPGSTSKPIPLERIMTLLHVDNADEQAALVEDHQYIDRIFAKLRA